MSKYSILLFLIIAAAVFFGLHFYVYTHVVNGFALSDKTANLIKIIFIIFGVSFFLGEFLNAKFNIFPVVYVAYIWLGALSIAVSVFFLKDITGLFLPFQPRMLTIVSLGLIVITSVYSFFNVQRKPVLKEIVLQLEKFPSSLSGFTIVQLSDLHFDNFTTAKWLETVVEETNKLHPDLIVITGDLIDTGDCISRNLCSILKELKSKYGVYAVTGNHEYYAGYSNFLRFSELAGIKVLSNQKITIAGLLELAGVDDDEARRFGGRGAGLKAALEGYDKNKLLILLNHRPIKFKEAVDMGVDLQLSGHTHAGQIPPMDLLVYMGYKYPFGLHKYNKSYIYTTFGTGIWGPPMRLFSRSEIVRIVLKSSPLRGEGKGEGARF